MFILKEEDITVKDVGLDGKIEAQVVSSEESDDHFKKRICAIWPNLCLFLKRQLERFKSVEPAENSNGTLFELRFKDGKFTLLTQLWAADILGLLPEITFDASSPEMIMPEIIALIKKDPQSQVRH